MENESLISDLVSCGWFTNLSSTESKVLKSKLTDGTPGTPQHLNLAAFVVEDPDRFGIGSLLDTPSEQSISTYEDLFKAYAQASDGRFAPEAIVEEADEDGAYFTIGFLAKGRIHALFIPGAPRLDIEINDLINESLADSTSERRFFLLPTADETVAFTYTTPAAFERASRLGIIPLEEELLTEFSDEALGTAESARPESYSLRCDYDLVTH